MINVDEHKKLLAQIKELEKNSINYFDVEKEFFLIDSNNLSQVRPRLYGYSIQATGIYEDDNLTPEAIANLDGRGCYVYVDVKDGQITIKQDLNGCWGIYLFRHGDYFALSNSFFRLLDHIKFKYPLTVNRDYCHYLLVNDLVSHAHTETSINEVRLIERNAIIRIDVAKQNLATELIDYHEHTVPLDSKEGIAILDKWIEFWSSLLRNVAQHTKFLQSALSGGFDTRIALIPLLHSGIDLSKMKINSNKSELHTYKEDYEIASQIAEHYDLKLNQPFPSRKFLNYTPNDVFNINLYVLQTFHKSAIYPSVKSIDKAYSISGYGGEIIRGNWLRFGTMEKFWQREMRIKPYSHNFAQELSRSIKNILESAFSAIRDKYKLEDQNSLWFAQYLYQETRCKHHFGKFSLGAYFKNEITLSPAIDPEIRTVRLETPECPDPKLLMALLFARHEPDLLNFPFDSNRFIAPETIEYAKKINERFPRPIKDVAKMTRGGVFYLQPRDLQTEKILADGKNNPAIPGGLSGNCLKAVFESSRTQGLFTAYFNSELYNRAAAYYDAHVFNRFNYMIGVVGVTKVLEDVEISQRNHPLYRDMQRFLEQDFCLIHKDTQIPENFKPYLTARISLKLITEGNLEILSLSDDKVKITAPAWLQRNGKGYLVFSSVGNLEIVAKASENITLGLGGMWVPKPENKSELIPYWIDYTKLTVNGKVILDKPTPTWHKKPYVYNIDIKSGEEIKIQVEWLPHKSND